MPDPILFNRPTENLAPPLSTSRFLRLAKESFWIAVGQGVAVLGALFGIRILSEMMTPSEYGLLALGLTLSTFSSQLLFGPLCAGSARFYTPAHETGELNSYLKGIHKLVLLGSGVILLLATGIIAITAWLGMKYWTALIVAALIFSIIAGYNSIASGIQNVARQRSIVALHAGMASWGRYLCAAGLMLALGVSSPMAMWGYAIATAIVLGSQYIFFRPILQAAGGEIRSSEDTSDIWQAKIISYSWPFATWGVFYWFQAASDRWALAMFSSAAEVGLFAVVYQLGYYPIALFTEMLVSLVSPILFQRAGDGTSNQRLSHASGLTKRIMGAVLLAAVAIFIITLLTHDWIFHLFVAKEYVAASYLLPWITISAGIFSAGQVLSIDRMSALDTKGLIAPKVTTAIIGGLLNILGAYMYGIEGVVAASLLFSVIYFSWLLFDHRRFTNNQSWPKRHEMSY